MASKRHTPEQIVAKLRQVDVLTSQGTSVADAIRSIGVTEVTYRRTAGRGDLLQPARGRDHHRELAQAFQCGTPARLSEISATGARGVPSSARRVAGGASWISFSGHAPASPQTSSQLTFTPDHQLGADQLRWPRKCRCRSSASCWATPRRSRPSATTTFPPTLSGQRTMRLPHASLMRSTQEVRGGTVDQRSGLVTLYAGRRVRCADVRSMHSRPLFASP